MSIRNVAAAICAIMTLLCTFAWTHEQASSYGEKVGFTKGAPLAFPDFSLEYVGQHRTSSEKYPRGFLFYDFKLRSKGAEKSISWSNGTGEIAPLDFEIDGKHFLLELQRSDKLGPLKENQLVIWKR